MKNEKPIVKTATFCGRTYINIAGHTLAVENDINRSDSFFDKTTPDWTAEQLEQVEVDIKKAINEYIERIAVNVGAVQIASPNNCHFAELVRQFKLEELPT